MAMTLVVAGAILGAALGVMTPAHLVIAGSKASIRARLGRAYDEMTLSGNVLTGKRATGRSVVGEPLGVSVHLQLDPSTFISADGSFNSGVLPAYVQVYSDPEQLTADVRWALIKHVLLDVAAGASVGAAGFVTMVWLRRARRHRLARMRPAEQRAALRYNSYLRNMRHRAVVAVLVLATIVVLPSGTRVSQPPAPIQADPLLADTPLAGTQVGGLLKPALAAIEKYIKTYIADTNAYYNQVRTKLLDYLSTHPVTLPSSPSVANVLFVTDRHCNIGMDRVIVAFAQSLGITVLISGGDDAFSGTFAFESACTQNLATKSQRAGMVDVFVGGNHDSPRTLTAEAEQHIKVLNGQPVTADGLTFTGIPDPRTSRFGQGMRPRTGQRRLLLQQGERAGRLACGTDGPVIIVLHDPLAGQTALHHGCGKATLALDGHTHVQAGPTPVALPNTRTGYTFVGGSTGGGTPTGVNDRSVQSRLTVGPLHHQASFSVISIDRNSGALVEVTACHISPQQDISVQQITP